MNPRRFSLNGQGGMPLPDRLRNASDAVRPILDQINKGLATAEKRLRACQPVTEVWYAYRSERAYPDGPDELQINHCIGVAKHNGEWRLCCGTTHDGFPEMDVTGVEPASEQSRSVRLELADCLPKWFPELQERIVREAEEFVPRARNALANMLAGLGEI